MNEPKESPLNNLAIQFAQVNSQEQRWLRDEIKQLRCILKAVINQNGGSVFVYDRELVDLKGDDVTLEVEEDKANRRIILR